MAPLSRSESIYGNTRNASAFGRFSYNLDKDTTFFTQLSLAQANEFDYFFPSQQEASRQTITYFKDNAFLPLATQAAAGQQLRHGPQLSHRRHQYLQGVGMVFRPRTVPRIPTTSRATSSRPPA